MSLFEVISGSEFNEKYEGIIFYKLTNDTENHHGLQYKDGLNEDIIPFSSKGECTSGGIYFTDGKNIEKWIHCCNNSIVKWIREVQIPNDAKIYIEKNKYKTDKIILNERKLFWEIEKLCKLAVQQNGYVLKYIKIQTEEICKLAVQEYGLALKYVKIQTEEICKLAVQQNEYALEFVQK